MQHPYYDSVITAEVEGEWWLGKPNGLCWFNYQDLGFPHLSFRAAGVFKQGLLHGGPATIICEDGLRLGVTNYKNGKRHGIEKVYNREQVFKNVKTMDEKQNVSGWLSMIRNVDEKNQLIGF